MRKQRYTWIDMARGIGIFAVVLGHLLRDGGKLNYWLYSFHVPLFFFISGAVFSTRNKSFRQFVKKLVKNIMVPYVVFSIISLVIYLILGSIVQATLESNRDAGLLECLYQIVWGMCDANVPLWFLPCMFVWNILMFPIIRMVEKISDLRNRVVVLIAIASCCAVITIINLKFIHYKELFWHADTAIYMMTFSLLGYCFFQLSEWISRLLNGFTVSLSVLLIAAGAVLGMNCNRVISYIRSYYGNFSIFYVSALCSIIGISCICLWIDHEEWFAYIGKHTLAILVMHKFPVLFFQCMCPWIKTQIVNGVYIWCIIATAISIVMCCIAEWVIDHICPWILGHER